MVEGSSLNIAETPLPQPGKAPALRTTASPPELCVHQLIERQAARTPEALAVAATDQTLSYRELNERANQLAHFLRRQGVGPNVLVAYSLERCCDVAVAILGILKAGGAYVPLDPTYPQERLSFMLQDSRAVLLLTHQNLAEKFASFGTPILCLDSQWASLAGESCENPEPTAALKDLIYVIYTSGSTGRPKGAGVYHRGFANLMRWYITEFDLQASEKVLLVSSLSFDLTQKNLYAPLMQGGQLHLLPNGPFDPARIQQLIHQHGITLINCTPSAFYPVIEPAGPNTWQKVASLRWVVLGGEPISVARLRAWLQNELCQAEVANTYGPTECTDIAAFYRLHRGNLDCYGFVPTGRPLPNVQVVIVDEHLAPCPVGEAGQLCIGGIGVGAGYLQDSTLTAAKFIPNPFAEVTSSRLYKTGDLARYLPDGNIEFLGRMDHQVKIRGFRIELQEIENALAPHPAIKEAVVTASKPSGSSADAPTEPRLVAYYVFKPGTSAAAGELRRFLKDKLPDYMVPSAFVPLEEFPLSPNGKVDRKALPAPAEQTATEQPSALPADPVQRRIAEIWQEVLHRHRVGVADNFFELGGDSLQLAQMISRVREAFQVELPVARVFETPTIDALAQSVAAEAGTAGSEPALPPLLPATRNGTAPLSFAQREFWFLERLTPGHPASHIPAALRLEGPLDPAALQQALEEITRRHEILRSTFPSQNGEPVQLISPEAKVQLEQVDLRALTPAEREQRVQSHLQAHARRTFDLERGPLTRWLWLRLGEQEHILAVAMHHIVSDGWTLAVLFQELHLLYGALAAQKPVPPLPALPVQYADYALWQHQWLRGPVLERQLAYWQEKLAGAPNLLDLPCDHAGAINLNIGALDAISLPPALVERTLDFCRREGLTPFMLWLAALALTLHRWTEQPDFVIGTVVAGRNRREIENLIGCFINFLPLRLHCQGQQSARGFLDQIKRTVREAQAHQDCPFDKIVETLNPERHLGQAPLYNVAFLLQNYPVVQPNSPGLTARPVPVPLPSAQLDLRFVGEEIEGQTTLTCEYRPGLFEPGTIRQLLAGFQSSLQLLLQDLGTEVAAVPLPAELRQQAQAARARKERQTIAVAATFTAEPLAESLEYWFKELDLPAKVAFAPYNQVFQQLLDPNSLVATNRRGLNLVLLRWEDWETPELERPARASQLERNIEEFLQALQAASRRSAVPWLVCLCPRRPGPATHSTHDQALEARLAAALEPLPGVHWVGPTELNRLYPVADYYDPQAEALGQIPYTPAYFAALGTLVARKFHALSRPAYKVVVLDCDETLWAGVCGEEGDKVRLDAGRQALQEFMRAQAQAGRLLCLCSKNQEADVLNVLRRRSDMPLRLDHLAGWRINWQPKSENLKALAAELRLGLDSFIFIDDNPVECAEVEANCPEVLTLQLPEQPDLIPRFLQHCWALDLLKLSAEDRQRSQSYQQERQREQFRTQTASLADFIAGLNLQVEITPLQPEQLARAAQLTQRTNQFNFTTRRRTEPELQTLRQQGWEVTTVSVTDRFGDYGLVGLMIWRTTGLQLDLDTFLLSCRVLGRGVEHQMLAHLGNLAVQRGVQTLRLHFQATAKNEPALNFLQQAAGPLPADAASQKAFVQPVAASRAAGLRLNPEPVPNLPAPNGSGRSAASKSQPDAMALLARRAPYRRIALQAAEPGRILQVIEEQLRQPSEPQDLYVAPRSATEKQLCHIWEQGLRRARVGIRDDFFALGGNSLLAVRLFAQIEKQTGQKLPLVTIFQAPTVEHLAQVLDRQAISERSPLVPIQPQGSRPPLFLVHGAGGDILWGYANLVPYLGQDQPVYGLTSPVSDHTEEVDTLEEMAARYVQAIRQVQPQGPYFLGGYCFGGNVAYEMARQLHAQGELTALVALLDCAPANCGYERMRWWQPSYAPRFARNLLYWLADFAQLKAEERCDFVLRKARTWARKLRRKLSGQPLDKATADVDLEEVIDLSKFPPEQLRLWQLHLNALERHVSRPYAGHVTLFRTRGQPLFCSLQEDFGWGKLAAGGVDIRLVPGSHETIFVEPAVQHLAKALKAAMDEATPAQALAAA